MFFSLTDLTLFSCGLCRGVFTEEEVRNTHKSECDGSVKKSDTSTFLCARKHYLKICGDIFNIVPRKRGRPRKNVPKLNENQELGKSNSPITSADIHTKASAVEINEFPEGSEHTNFNVSMSEHSYTMHHAAASKEVQKLTTYKDTHTTIIAVQRKNPEVNEETRTSLEQTPRRSLRGFKPKLDRDYVNETLTNLKTKHDVDGDTNDEEWVDPAEHDYSSDDGEKQITADAKEEETLDFKDGTQTEHTAVFYKQFQAKGAMGTRSSQRTVYQCPNCHKKVPKLTEFAKHYDNCGPQQTREYGMAESV